MMIIVCAQHQTIHYINVHICHLHLHIFEGISPPQEFFIGVA